MFHRSKSPVNEKSGKYGFFQKLQGKLVLLLLILLVPTLLIQFYIVEDKFQNRREEELQHNLEIARVVSRAFESFVQDVLNQELAIGSAITASQPMTTEDILRLLRQCNSGNPTVRDFSWVGPDGRFLHSSNPALIGTNGADRPYFTAVANGREWAVGELIIARTTGKPIFSISRGFRDNSGRLLGIVVAMIIPERLSAIFSLERAFEGAISIIDHKGMLVYRHPAVDLSWEDRNRLKQFPIYQKALDGKEFKGVFPGSYGGQGRLAGIAPIYSIGWVAGAGYREKVVMDAIRDSLYPQSYTLLAFTLLVFGLALFCSRNISGSVARFRDHALALGRGERRILPEVSGMAELRELADAFQKMVQDIDSREEERRRAENALTEARNQLELRVQERTAELTCANKILREQAALLDLAHDAILVRDMEHSITYWSNGAEETYGWTKEEALGSTLPVLLCTEFPKPMEEIIAEIEEIGQWEGELRHVKRNGDGIVVASRWAILRNRSGEPSGILEINRDITERKKADLERELLIDELREALARINTLSGLLPICSHCKKIRNDEGYWQQIESYIHQHSGTQFSHGICPDCLKKHYSDFLGDRLERVLAGENM